MLNDINKIINRLKVETNNTDDIIYRKKNIQNRLIHIIYLEALTSSDKISDFIIRSLTNIEKTINHKKDIPTIIENSISNFKIVKISSYEKLCSYLHLGYTIILIDDLSYGYALETKSNISRSIDKTDTEITIRGPKDAFVEDFQKNIGLIRKRIKSNNLWQETLNIGKYTNTKISLLYINGIIKKELVEKVLKKLKSIDIDGIIDSGTIKNFLTEDSQTLFPTIYTTERPDIVSHALLKGKIAILIDNSPYVLIIPGEFKEYFITSEDVYTKSFNVSIIRILKYLAFTIALLAPAVYIALVTYNQEMLPPELLISFAIQRDTVPFPAFVEAFIMIIAFEIIREADLRVPGFTGSSLSIVGALILGEAAVNAGIVSPIMIIVVAITALSSLPFTEPEIVNALRWWRLIFMASASFLGITGIIFATILFLTKLASIDIFDIPYLIPFVPINITGLKNSIIKLPLRKLNKRENYLSENTIKEVFHEKK